MKQFPVIMGIAFSRKERPVSWQTAEARAGLRNAERELKEHLTMCPQCSRAQRVRHYDELCFMGLELREIRNDCRAEVERQRVLDQAPIEGQEVLF